MKFPFLKPVLPPVAEWSHHLDESYETRYFSNFGPVSRLLEAQLSSKYLLDTYSGIATASATAGLVAALQQIGVANRCVAVPDFTFAATIQAIFAAGGIPIICDIDPHSWELCPTSLSKAHAECELAAVVHVRPFGLVRDIGKVRAFCAEREMPLVVDAAACLGPIHEPTFRFGSQHGEVEVFSLHATKVLAIGEGGFIAAPDETASEIRSRLNFGFNEDRTFGDGLNGKLDEFRSAIGLAALERLESAADGRSAHAAFYREHFSSFSAGHQLPEAAENSSWSMFPIRTSVPVTDDILQQYAAEGIEAKKYYWPTLSAGYKGDRQFGKMPTPVADRIADNFICFPIYSEFEEEVRKDLHLALNRAHSHSNLFEPS